MPSKLFGELKLLSEIIQQENSSIKETLRLVNKEIGKIVKKSGISFVYKKQKIIHDDEEYYLVFGYVLIRLFGNSHDAYGCFLSTTVNPKSADEWLDKITDLELAIKVLQILPDAIKEYAEYLYQTEHKLREAKELAEKIKRIFK